MMSWIVMFSGGAVGTMKFIEREKVGYIMWESLLFRKCEEIRLGEYDGMN